MEYKQQQEEEEEELEYPPTNSMVSELEALVLAQQRELELKSQQLEQLDLELQQQQQEDDGDAVLREINTLMQQLDYLKQEEKDFKLSCRMERDRLQEFCPDPFPDTPIEAMLDMRERIDLILKKHRVKLASVSRTEANFQRKEDEGITPSERKQYEQRFTELYEEIALMSDLHRKQVAIFNSSTSKLRLIKGQIDLLSSIRNGFLRARAIFKPSKPLLASFPAYCPSTM